MMFDSGLVFVKISTVVILFRLVLWATKKSVKYPPPPPKEFKPLPKSIPIELQRHLDGLQDIWDPDRLKDFFALTIEKWKGFKTEISDYFLPRFAFLQNISNQDPNVLRSAGDAILRMLAQDFSSVNQNRVKIHFSWVLEQAPFLNMLFSENGQKNNSDGQSEQESRDEEFVKNHKRDMRNLFGECNSLQQVKKRFRKLALLNHPDHGGKEKAMKEILKQYKEALDRFIS